jgi:hypothetical protein
MLVDLTFLGIEVQQGRFEFLLNDSERPKFRSMARHLSDSADPAVARYRIATPFHAYLEVSRSSSLPFGDDGD